MTTFVLVPSIGHGVKTVVVSNSGRCYPATHNRFVRSLFVRLFKRYGRRR